jgi:hypothetical protein
LEQEASYTEGWGMEAANSSFSDDPQGGQQTPTTTSRARKRKSTAAPETVSITKRTKTDDVKQEVFSDEEEEEENGQRSVKLEEEEEEEEEERRGKKDTEFVARVRRVNRAKSDEEVGDDECYQLRGWRSGRRWVIRVKKPHSARYKCLEAGFDFRIRIPRKNFPAGDPRPDPSGPL